MDAIQLLTIQHRAIESRMASLLEAPVEQRAALLVDVGDELGEHLASEEEVFYPAVREQRTEDILLESLEEHLSLKRLLADLLPMPATEPQFTAKFKVLKEQAEHHHREEEEHLFPKVLRVMDVAARAALGERMVALQLQLQRRGKGEAAEALAAHTDEAAPLV